ncbi:MAG: CPBP family intramembrane glutamic endopeptidase, partial [Myxococcota bacterium]
PSDPAEISATLEQLSITPAFLSASVAVNATLCTVIALAGARLSRRRVVECLRLGPTPSRGVITGAVSAVGFLSLSQALSSAQNLIAGDIATSLSVIERAVVEASGTGFLLVLFATGLMAGAGEEIFFRGFMQTRLRRRWGAWPAILITSVAFGLLHFDWIHSPMAFCMGLFLGWITETTGSIRPAIAAHVVNNSTWVLTAGLWGGEASPWLEIGILASSCAGLMAAVVLLRGLFPAGPTGA